MSKKTKIKMSQARGKMIAFLRKKTGIGSFSKGPPPNKELFARCEDHLGLSAGGFSKAQRVERILRALGEPMPDLKVRPKQKREKYVRPAHIDEFYKSFEWRRARYQALMANDGRCECCGMSRGDGVKLHVDHIKSLRNHWERRVDPSNLQVLCELCNHGKGNWDATDWREPSLRVVLGERMK